ncbi:hypothetical protein CRUP_037718, partial [Coryphaenoides rupestris]
MAALRRLGSGCRVTGPLCSLSRAGRGVPMAPSIGTKRNLLSENVVKLQDFQQRKLDVAHLARGPNGNYVEDFHHKLQRRELIRKDELNLLLHVCQSVDDMAVARVAIQRYHEETPKCAVGEYKFGPLFIRLCYELSLEEMAAATLKDKKLRGFFSDMTSFNIAVDMLFTKGSYDSALELLRDMMSQGVAFNKDTYMLACATCYKLVVMLAMSGQVSEAISVVSSAMSPKSIFVKKLEFAQEVKAAQVTQRSLDDMLCQAPPPRRKPLSDMGGRS